MLSTHMRRRPAVHLLHVLRKRGEPGDFPPGIPGRPEQCDRPRTEAAAHHARERLRVGPARLADDHDLSRRTEAEVHGDHQLGVSRRCAPDPRRERGLDLLGPPLELGIAGQPSEAQQVEHGHRVRRRHGPVVDLPAAHRKLVRLRGHLVQPASRVIPETLEQILVQAEGLAQEGRVERRLVRLQQPPHEKGVVLGERRYRGFPIPVAVQETSLRIDHPRADELQGRDGGLQVVGPLERRRSLRERSDHQAVPVGQDLVILRRPDPALPSREQLLACPF